MNNQNEKYFKAYIGKNYDKIVNQKFSIPAFFLGGLYLFYRKATLVGIIYTIIYAVCQLMNKNISLICCLIAMTALGLTFKKIYLKHVEKEISKLKNKTASEEELIKLCNEKGGTASAILTTIGWFFYYGMLLLFLSLLITAIFK